MRFLPLCAPALLAASLWGQHGLSRIGQVRLDYGSPIWAVGFSPDGSKLAIGWGEYSDGVETTGLITVVAADDPKRILGRADYRPLSLVNPALSEDSRY